MKQILVVGCGGIGERHIRCFLRTKRVEVSVCEVNPSRRQEIESKYVVAGFADLTAAWKERSFEGVVICTPADKHVDIALSAIEHGAALLIEKPLSVNWNKVDLLQAEACAREIFVRVAYVNRVRRGCGEIRELLRRGELGSPLQVCVSTGQHFPSFRPDYQRIYYARHETGGGAIQDALTHLANLVEWFVGPTTRLYCEAACQALEGVGVEDTVNVIARNRQILVSYALNQFQTPNETTVSVHCAQGSVRMEFHKQRWSVCRQGAAQWEHHPAPFQDRDDLFVAQADAFLDGMEGKPTPLCPLDEAIQTLRFNLAALESARKGQSVSIVT